MDFVRRSAEFPPFQQISRGNMSQTVQRHNNSVKSNYLNVLCVEMFIVALKRSLTLPSEWDWDPQPSQMKSWGFGGLRGRSSSDVSVFVSQSLFVVCWDVQETCCSKHSRHRFCLKTRQTFSYTLEFIFTRTLDFVPRHSHRTLRRVWQWGKRKESAMLHCFCGKLTNWFFSTTEWSFLIYSIFEYARPWLHLRRLSKGRQRFFAFAFALAFEYRPWFRYLYATRWILCGRRNKEERALMCPVMEARW